MASIRSSIPRPDPKSRSPAPSTYRRRNSAPSTPDASPSFLPLPSATASRSNSRSPRDSGIAFVLDCPRTPQSALPIGVDEAISRTQARISQFARTSGGLLMPVPAYIGPHIDACTSGSLVHRLQPCGHQVITGTPETCASNCRREYNEKTLRWATAVVTNECFVCAACVNIHVQEHRHAQLQNQKDRFARTEARMGHFRPEWLEKQMAYARRVLDNDVEKEKKEFEKLGRPCLMISGEPLDTADETAIKLTAARMPWPPRQSPKGNRSPGTTIRGSLLNMPGSVHTRHERHISSGSHKSERVKKREYWITGEKRRE